MENIGLSVNTRATTHTENVSTYHRSVQERRLGSAAKNSNVFFPTGSHVCVSIGRESMREKREEKAAATEKQQEVQRSRREPATTTAAATQPLLYLFNNVYHAYTVQYNSC